ncbi:MAG TPA: hemerythrin domain-containing protein [Candidatus Limnocylindria bacterium]
MRILDRFSSEHDVFVTQLGVIETLTRTGAEVASVVAAIRTLAAPLLVHAQNEERALFPALASSLGGEGGPLAVLTEEHRVLHGQLDRLTGDPPRWELVQVLDEFVRLLRGHIEKEEGILFPAASQLIDDPRLERLDRELRSAVAAVGG